MLAFFELISKNIEKIVPSLRTILILVVVFIALNSLINFIKRKLLEKADTKKHISNVDIFSNMSKYVLIIILILVGISSYSGSWVGLGLGIGLFSAALGWALQKPITGIAAWIMIVIKRPFDIGDRVIIGGVKGDIVDITLSHIYIAEVGGIVAGEEVSGRTVLVPNSILFEQNIINYTSKNEYVLDQVSVTITYESNLDKALKLIIDAAKEITEDIIKKTGKQPYARTYFEPSGMGVHLRYFTYAKNIQQISSDITKKIYDKIKKEKGIEIAYPHTELLFRKK